MAHEAVMGSTGTNGDLPTDVIERAVTDLMHAAEETRAKRDTLKGELDSLNDQLSRYDRAVKALTAPKRDTAAISEKRLATMAAKKRGPKTSEPGVANAAQGYPVVSSERQQKVLDALIAIGEPVGVQQLAEAGDFNKSTVQNALAHLRARNLVRWAGKKGSGHLYAPYADSAASTDSEGTD